MTLDLDKLENLHQSTTPGPWTYIIFDAPSRTIAHPKGFICTTHQGDDNENAEWIVAAHEAFPAMLDRIRALTDELLLTQADLERCQDQRDDAEQRSEREYEDR